MSENTEVKGEKQNKEKYGERYFEFELTEDQAEKFSEQINEAMQVNERFPFICDILILDKEGEKRERPLLEGKLLLGEIASEAKWHVHPILLKAK